MPCEDVQAGLCLGGTDRTRRRGAGARGAARSVCAAIRRAVAVDARASAVGVGADAVAATGRPGAHRAPRWP
ncbi:hypothetical protein ACWEKM_30530 [Streptomyces sp. NPDC004752]